MQKESKICDSYIDGFQQTVTQSGVGNHIFDFGIESGQALTIVRDESFKGLVRYLQPKKHVMSYQTLIQTLSQKHELMKSKLLNIFSDLDCVRITTDL